MTSTTSPVLLPGAEPFSADGGRIGVLLSHGFTGSPASMTPWGKQLASLGHTVRVPRLPGHGTTWQDLNTTRWEQWYAEVDAALTELRSTCDHVVVAGLSMGGCLVLRLAEQRPDDVDAVVVVNPVVNLARFDLKLLPVLKLAVRSMPGIGNDIKKPGQDEVGYTRTPLKALSSQLVMWKDVRDNLDKITQPLLIFKSDEDHVLDATSVDLIRAGVSSKVLDFVALPDSYHVATIDNDDQLIFDRTAAFIAEHVGTPMTDRDDFDRIVEGLELDLSFVDEKPEPTPEKPAWSPRADDEIDAEEEEPFYRKVDPVPLVPRRRNVLLAWVGVLGAPMSLVIATVSGVVLDRPIVAAASLTFVGAAIYLILQLPEHGPSRRDWPDDGAVL